MKKIYLLLFIAFAYLGVNAQVYHFSEKDTALHLESWWVSNATVAWWELKECEELAGNYYALYTWDLSLQTEDDTLTTGTWQTDAKFDASQTEGVPFDSATVKAAQSDLYVNFFVNAFDGVNAEDSIKFVFELKIAGEKYGWPGITIEPVGSEWKWVSLKLSDLTFSGTTSGTPSELPEIGTIKFSFQPAKNYTGGEGAWKLGIQDMMISNGPGAEPEAKPCVYHSSVQDFELNSTVFYPNPAASVLNFKEESSGSIIDLSGRIVKSFNKINRVNVSDIHPGMYFIQVNDQPAAKLIVE